MSAAQQGSHKAGSCCSGHAHGDHAHHHGKTPAADVVRDPVCGMTVDPHKTAHRHQHQGHTYYFGSKGCLTKFAAEPAKYLEDAPRAAEAVPEGTIFTCPMHP